MTLNNYQRHSFSGMIFALISFINVRKQFPNVSNQEMIHEMQFLGDYRKRWYQRAMEKATTQWKTLSNSHATTAAAATTKSSKLWKNNIPKPSTNNGKLRKCSSLSMASSFTRVCLCAPISSYNEVFRGDHHQYVPPRRSNSYPRSKPFPATTHHQRMINPNTINNIPSRVSTEGRGRRVFRGKSLTDDVLMRRFVVEEEAMVQMRRRNQMEVIRRRSVMRRKKLGPSPLSRMAVAEEHEMLHFS